MTPYAELQVTTNFSFLRGASHPHELVARAAALGHAAIGVTDRNSLAGVVRMHIAAKEAGLRLVVGARLDLEDGPSLLAFPTDRAAYGRLARLITLGRRRAPKGACALFRQDVLDGGEGMIFVAIPPRRRRMLSQPISPNSRPRFRGTATSPWAICCRATIRRAWPVLPSCRAKAARRWWRPMTSICTTRRGGRWPMC